MSDLIFMGKVAIKSAKQINHERLLKAKVKTASELAKFKQEEIDRVEAFVRAAEEEEFINRTERSKSPRCPTPIGQRVGIIAREPYEEQP